MPVYEIFDKKFSRFDPSWWIFNSSGSISYPMPTNNITY